MMRYEYSEEDWALLTGMPIPSSPSESDCVRIGGLRCGKTTEAIRNLRAHFAAEGHPIDHLTDEEIRTRSPQFVAIAAQVGLSFETVAQNAAAVASAGLSFYDLFRHNRHAAGTFEFVPDGHEKPERP